jgi:trans-2,3-dihydro-3-hydroxyanthranilate isomerase
VSDQAIERLAAYAPLGDAASGLRYLLLDVFSSKPLEGNQLAVVLDGRGLEDARMQALARELNLSETVFLLPADGDESDVRARIFTPAAELPFAGHPVLGTAAVVSRALALPAVTLETGAGPVPVEVQERGARVSFGWMRQPLPRPSAFDQEAALLGALGLEASALPVTAYENGPRHIYVAVQDEAAVAALRPDFGALARLGEGIGVNCFAGAGSSFKSRMFAPALGVPEDPATGSAAGPLALHLARHGRIAYGQEIEIRQGAEIGRPSLLHARVRGSDEELEAVEVGGAAVLVAAGAFVLD